MIANNSCFLFVLFTLPHTQHSPTSPSLTSTSRSRWIRTPPPLTAILKSSRCVCLWSERMFAHNSHLSRHGAVPCARTPQCPFPHPRFLASSPTMHRSMLWVRFFSRLILPLSASDTHGYVAVNDDEQVSDRLIE